MLTLMLNHHFQSRYLIRLSTLANASIISPNILQKKPQNHKKRQNQKHDRIYASALIVIDLKVFRVVELKGVGVE
jgi:hypothetical protein